MKTESKNARELHLKRKFSYERIEAYHQQFIDGKTGYFYDKYTELRSCPVCGSNKNNEIFKKSGGTYVKCNSCTMIFTNPVFKESVLKEYYKNLNTGQAEITSNESDFYREIYSIGLNAITNHASVRNILDIGCSSGFFLDIAKENNWNTKGIELNISESELCKEKGHLVYTEPLEDIRFNNKFEAITLWDVFEHIPHPRKYLSLLSNILSDDGVIFMQIPNSSSLAARILREKCNMFDGIEHLNLYNPRTLQLIAESNGFLVVHLASIISEISVINNSLSYEDPYFGSIEYKDEVLGFISKKVIHDKLLGYKMQVVLKKNKKNKN